MQGVIADRGGRFGVDAHGKTSPKVNFRDNFPPCGWFLQQREPLHPWHPLGPPPFPAAKFVVGNPALTNAGLW